MTERFGYSLSVLEASVNNQAHDVGYERLLVDRQLQLAYIERLEHIALALENLSDVGDVVASKLTFGVVPGAESYGPMADDFAKQGVALPFCDAPGCKESAVYHAVIDNVGRHVCVMHRPMLGKLNPNPDTPLGGPDAE